MKLTPEIAELIRNGRPSNEEIIRIVQLGFQQGTIYAPPKHTPVIFHAGGTNMCPNSDFAFSHLAATVADTDPTDSDPDNQLVYRVFFQENEAPLGSALVKANPTDRPYYPGWDKVQGIIKVGSSDIAGGLWDIAIQFTNNWLVGNRKWYVRVAVALDGEDPIPEGAKIFAGFWVKRAGSEGWATGDNFTLTSKILGLAGTREFNYKVIAKTDTGRTIESAILNITNIPDTLGGLAGDNQVRITYPGALGFIEFFLYRQDASTLRVDLIARDRNSSKLFAYDTGQSIQMEAGGFPEVEVSDFRAYEEIQIDAVDIAVQKTFHEFVIVIPANLDTSDIIREGTYLRIGLLGVVTNDQQVLLDTVWAAESYNVWSPSPFDDYPSAPSTSMTTSYPGSGPVGDPPHNGGTCVWEGHDMLMDEGWCVLSDVVPGAAVSGGYQSNTVAGFIDAEVSQYFKVVFNCGLVILCTPTHRFLRSFNDGSGLMVSTLKAGQVLLGSHEGEPRDIMIESLELITTTTLNVRTPRMTPKSPTRYFAIGDRATGWVVWCHNEKNVNP